MSILIPGISPPANCGECDHPTCTLWHGHDANRRHKDCPIIELLPHGRLVEAERLEFELCESTMPKVYRDFCKRVINSENLTPTVIPAEEE